MPTSPLWERVEVRFPAEFTARYMSPLAFFGAPPSIFGGAVDGVEWPPNDGFANDNDLWHKDKERSANEEVARAVRNRQVQRINQMTHSGRVQLAGMRDALEGGGRYGGTPTTIEGAPVLAGRGLRGGVMRTQAGRQHVVSRLQSRVGELNQREAIAQQIPMPPTPMPEAGMDGQEEIEAIGDFLDILDDNFTSGAIDAEALSAARGLLKNITSVGYLIPQNLITPTLRQVEEMLSNLEAISNSIQPNFGIRGERAKRLRTIFQVLERVRSALEELSRVSDLSRVEREMAMEAGIQGRRQQVVQQRTRRPRNLPPAVPLPRGETGYVYPYATQERPFRPARRTLDED